MRHERYDGLEIHEKYDFKKKKKMISIKKKGLFYWKQ